MTQLFKVSLAGLFLLCSALFTSCAKSNNGLKPIETPKIETPGPKAGENPQDIVNSAKDVISCGGPAGQITLAGVFAKEAVTPDSFLTIQQYAGKGWRAECKSAKTSAVERIPELKATTTQVLEKLSDDKSYILVGCDAETIAPALFEGLEAAQPVIDDKSLMATLRANTVILCGDIKTLIKAASILVEANTVWVRGFGYTLSGTSASFMSISAINFGFSGSFGVTSVGTDGEMTISAGPSLFFSAQRFINKPDASYLRAVGSNYVEPKSK